jgi:hypothetical protein
MKMNAKMPIFFAASQGKNASTDCWKSFDQRLMDFEEQLGKV